MLSLTLPNRSEKQHHNINKDNVFGLRERRRKNRWTSAPGHPETLPAVANIADASLRSATICRWGIRSDDGFPFTTVRWKADDLERAIVDDLARMRLATPELASWFRTELMAAVSDLTAYRRRQATSLAKRKTELATMQDRLLNAYLTGTVEEAAYNAKSNELKAEAG